MSPPAVLSRLRGLRALSEEEQEPLAEGRGWAKLRQRGGIGHKPCMLGRTVTGSDRSRHSEEAWHEQRPRGRKLPEVLSPFPCVDTYLQMLATSVA